MGSICIVTDTTAQFSQPTFLGRDQVHLVSFDYSLNHESCDPTFLKVATLPLSTSSQFEPVLVAPTVEHFRHLFLSLLQSYDAILGIFLSSQLSACFSQAEAAVTSIQGHFQIQLIDSQSTSVGLGLLVQAAAEAAANGAVMAEVERIVRSMIPHLYSVFCTPNLSYLHSAGFLDPAQARVGELMGMLPIFALEEGRLNPLEKVRNRRQTLDFFQEFLDEFDRVQHIAILQSANPNGQDTRIFREHVQTEFSKVPFTEHSINLPLALLFGPSASGFFLLEAVNPRNRR